MFKSLIIAVGKKIGQSMLERPDVWVKAGFGVATGIYGIKNRKTITKYLENVLTGEKVKVPDQQAVDVDYTQSESQKA